MLSAVSFASVSCGGDDGDGAVAGSEPTGKGECGKGEYPGDHGTVRLCGKNAKCGKDGVPIEAFRGYTSYRWNMDITVGDEPDLSALSCLESVGGFTMGNGSSMTDLRGLERLKKASSVAVVKMEKFTSFAGLDSLASTVEVTVSFNDAMTDIAGLMPGFRMQRLAVYDNPVLTSLAGLAEVEITGRVMVDENIALSKCIVDELGDRFPNIEVVNSNNLEATCP